MISSSNSVLAQLERACGGVLINRYTRTHRLQTMTSLGRALHGHFGRAIVGPLEGLPDPLACAVARLRGEQRVRGS